MQGRVQSIVQGAGSRAQRPHLSVLTRRSSLPRGMEKVKPDILPSAPPRISSPPLLPAPPPHLFTTSIAFCNFIPVFPLLWSLPYGRPSNREKGPDRSFLLFIFLFHNTRISGAPLRLGAARLPRDAACGTVTRPRLSRRLTRCRPVTRRPGPAIPRGSALGKFDNGGHNFSVLRLQSPNMGRFYMSRCRVERKAVSDKTLFDIIDIHVTRQNRYCELQDIGANN